MLGWRKRKEYTGDELDMFGAEEPGPAAARCLVAESARARIFYSKLVPSVLPPGQYA